MQEGFEEWQIAFTRTIMPTFGKIDRFMEEGKWLKALSEMDFRTNSALMFKMGWQAHSSHLSHAIDQLKNVNEQ